MNQIVTESMGQSDVLRELKPGEKLTAFDISHRTGCNISTTRGTLRRLIDLGEVECVGVDESGGGRRSRRAYKLIE